MEQELTAQTILEQVRRMRTAREPAAAEAYRQAAAVLAALNNPEQLRPVSGVFEPGAGVATLGSDLVNAHGSRLRGKLTLRHEARRGALQSLGTRARMLEALEANPSERVGDVQVQFENYLRSSAKPLREQSNKELECTLQVLLWLEDILPDLPPAEAVRDELAARTFMPPFEELASDQAFKGRVVEMEQLRSFVGILPPQTLRGRLTRTLFQPSRVRALSVFGPGGVGKSALLARFILEHSRLPQDLRVPIAYLDFDRSTLSITEHRNLVEEMVRQLIIQFPDEEDFKQIRTALKPDPAAGDESSTTGPRRLNLEHALNGLIRTVERVVPGRPYVVIFDTFEQVQYLGEAHALTLWQILDKVQERFPIVRIVVSGRAPVAALRLGGELPERLQVGDLDHEAAVAFVMQQGGFSTEIAKVVVAAVGGVPLSLKLATRLLRTYPQAELNLGSRFWLRAADEVIQGQLFDRILAHIADLEVRRVAHPGLVLRRLTPEILLEVLKEPCQLSITSLAEAGGLFARLHSEVSLVTTSDDGDGALVHRRELREVMLRLLKQRAPAVVVDISNRAIEYYMKRDDIRDRIEQVYHELLISRFIPKTVFEDRDVRASTQAAITELPAESQQLLASYGFQVDPTILEKATLEQREASVAEFVEQRLPHGARGLADARARLTSTALPDYDSPLWRAWGRLRFEAGDNDGAAEAVTNGLRHAIVAGSSFRVLELLSDQAWQVERGSAIAPFDEALERLADYAARHDDAAAMVQHFLQRGRGAAAWFQGKTDHVGIERLFRRLRVRDFFGLLPATRGFWSEAANWLPASVFVDVVLDPDSTFESVTFPTSREADVALQAVLRSAFGVSHRADGDWRELASALDRLVKVWPYKNLHLHPPQADSRRLAR